MAKLFNCQEVKIYKTEETCLGSYGAVYRAKRDELPCAAKFLHPTLLQSNKLDTGTLAKKFQQECVLLSKLQHPNIVQYLGTYQDKESGLMVLLTELLDENLTRYLDRCTRLLPYCIQVDISHDVALAIAYLHSNKIIHRDLSSNNVLMLEGRRAKVGDFGMSETMQAHSASCMAYSPGTEVYMPPEAFANPPTYSDKLDCFSLGPLILQILTRLYPQPGPRLKEVPSPTGKIEVPILEIERRKNHTDLIEVANPLLAIAQQCIHQCEEERPSAHHICCQLDLLKREEQYQADNKTNFMTACSTNAGKEENLLLHVRNHALTKEIKHLTEELHTTRKELENMTSKKALALEKLTSEIAQLKRTLDNSEKCVVNLLVRIEQKDAENKKLQQQTVNHLLQAQIPKREKKSPIRRLGAPLHFKWTQRSNVPLAITSSSHTTKFDTLYILDSRSSKLYSYEMSCGNWSAGLPDCPQRESTLVCIKGVITAVGGTEDRVCTDKLISLVGEGRTKRWVRFFPPMPTKRSHPIVACLLNRLIVAGGAQRGTAVDTIEVLNTDTTQWFTATPLPFPIGKGGAVISKEVLYIVVYQGEKMQLEKTAVACSTKGLITSTDLEWFAITDLPAYFCTVLSVCGHLLGIGGTAAGKAREIYTYDTHKDKWRVASHMITARSSSIAAVSNQNQLVVLGGSTNDGPSGVVEAAEITLHD